MFRMLMISEKEKIEEKSGIFLFTNRYSRKHLRYRSTGESERNILIAKLPNWEIIAKNWLLVTAIDNL